MYAADACFVRNSPCQLHYIQRQNQQPAPLLHLTELVTKFSTVPAHLPVTALGQLCVVDLHVGHAEFYPVLHHIAQHCADVYAVRMHSGCPSPSRAQQRSPAVHPPPLTSIHAQFQKLRVLSVEVEGALPVQFSAFLGGFHDRLRFVQVRMGWCTVHMCSVHQHVVHRHTGGFVTQTDSKHAGWAGTAFGGAGGIIARHAPPRSRRTVAATAHPALLHVGICQRERQRECTSHSSLLAQLQGIDNHLACAAGMVQQGVYSSCILCVYP